MGIALHLLISGVKYKHIYMKWLIARSYMVRALGYNVMGLRASQVSGDMEHNRLW